MKNIFKPVKYWCYGCGNYMIENGRKCPVCGNVVGVKIVKNKENLDSCNCK